MFKRDRELMLAIDLKRALHHMIHNLDPAPVGKRIEVGVIEFDTDTKKITGTWEFVDLPQEREDEADDSLL